ncbi:MAG: SUMF1/EgtB/PvdO family nonheme iron enzyme [Cytophagales bacterium]|nr:SUMF1/EgtB/PvdO family nonheme iron enzyme [Cytophagales bacterium]
MSRPIYIPGLLFCLLLILGNQWADASFEPYSIALEGSDEQISMTPIKGGTFQMGSAKTSSSSPVHEVIIDDFWIGTYEITWDQFELFLYREIDDVQTSSKGGISMDIDAISGATMPYVNFNRPGYPAICMTQYAASQFCKWLTAKTGNFYRLPTEAEWEYACRGGTTTDFSAPKNQLADHAWFAENSDGQLQKGGQKAPNPWGLYDVHGNATEWVLDTYQSNYDHLKDKNQNPVHLEEELYPHVVRGGSFRDTKEELTSWARGYSTAAWKKQDPQFPKSLWWHTDATHVGFRIVRPLKTPDSQTMESFWINPIEEY